MGRISGGIDRNCLQHHAGGRVAVDQESVEHLQPLQGTGLALALAGGDGLAQRFGLGLHVEVLQTTANSFGAHVALEVLAELGPHLAEERLVSLQVADGDVLEAVPDVLDLFDLGICALAQLSHLLLFGVAQLLLLRGLGTLRLQLCQSVLELLGDRGDVGVALVGEVVDLLVDLSLQVGHVLVATVLVHVGDHVGGEVDDLLQVLRRQIEQVPQA